METREKQIRKLLIALPLLVLPFLALAFYALGGGKGSMPAQQQNFNKGINTDLPDAQFKKDDPLDKLSLYELIKRDSSGFKHQFGDMEKPEELKMTAITGGSLPDPNERRINEKLAQINKEIKRPVTGPEVQEIQPAYSGTQMTIRGDVDRLEKLMNSMQEGREEDPEMKQLSEMLDKIIAIQNPKAGQEQTVNRQKAPADSQFRAIPARIVSNQKAVQGASVKLQLQDTVTLNGLLIPKGHEITGTCRITNQRLLLDIKNIRLGTSIIPVDLSVYSLDGMPGINAPEAMLGDAASSGADDAIRGLGMYGIDQSIATQVAGAGIDAAKNMFRKKLRKIKVKLRAGEPVLLRNNESEKP